MPVHNAIMSCCSNTNIVGIGTYGGRECLGVDIGGSCGSIGGGCGLHGMCAYIHWLDRRFCMHACMPIPKSGGEDAIGTLGPGVETGGGIGVPDRFGLVARTLKLCS